MKKALIIGFIVILAAALLVGFFLWRNAAGRIGSDRALEIALNDAGLARNDVHDVEIDLERERGRTWYEITFDQGLQEYEYAIDARTGEIMYGGHDH